MSVQATTSKVSYSGNGSTSTAYPVPFYFQNSADLVVLLTDTNGLRTVLTQGTDYSVSGAGNISGGSITTIAAYASTNTLTIYREVEPTQLTSYAENDAFPAASHERALDKLTFLCQQLARKVKLCFRLTEDSADAPAIAPGQAGYVLQSNGPGLAPSFEKPSTVSAENGSITPAKLSTGGPSWDASGNLSATRFVGPLSGNATSATALQTSRAIGLSGVLSGSASFNGAADAAVAASFVQSPSFRNRIINGAMGVDQRNSGSSFSATANAFTYGPDRFAILALGASVSGQRVASGINDFPLALRVTGASGNTGMAVSQQIESNNSYDLVGQNVTVSFTASRSGGGAVTVFLYSATASDNFSSTTTIASQSISLTSSLARYTVTFASLPASAANGIGLKFSFGSGLGAGETFTITGVQLEAGSVATPFEYRSCGQELVLCQRYYWMPAVSYGEQSYASAANSFTYAQIWFPVTMRATPTISAAWTNGTNAVAASISALGSRGAQAQLASSGVGEFAAIINWTSFSSEL